MGKKLIVNLEIERKEVQFRVDTGADVSLLDECSWEKLGKPALSATTDKLRNASGKLMIFKGTVKKQVRFRNSIMEVLFYVKHGRGSNLLGMDWIKKTGLLNACAEFLKSLKCEVQPSVLLSEGTKLTDLQEVL